MSLGRAQLDVEAIVTKQRILLKSVPRGMAKILFTAQDFGNFLAHPFMKQAAATAVQVLPAQSVLLPLKSHCSCTGFMLLAATAGYASIVQLLLLLEESRLICSQSIERAL